MDIWISIVALIVSLLSFVVSVLALLLALGFKPSILVVDVPLIKDDFDLLFCEDGRTNNEFLIKIVNENNRDILIHLVRGYICNNNKKYSIESGYYSLKANDITPIKLKINVGSEEKERNDKKISLIFEYRRLRRKTIKYERK